jgi:xanthine dehydrogenase YagR molybdenum-binding subunit
MAKRIYKEHNEESAVWYRKLATDQSKSTPEGPSADEKEKFNIIGKYTRRIDGKKIVNGRAPYTHDITLRGMLVGKILRSPHAKAEILSVDLSQAKNLKGVKAAVQLKQGQIRYAGEQIAAVAAVDEKTAERALEKIKVEYKPLPFVVSVDKSMEESAPQVHPDQPNVRKFNDYKRGDVEKGFQEADAVIERTYKTSIEIHHPTETHGSIAKWEGKRLIIWDSTQAVHNVRDQLARDLQIPASRITVIKHYMGGGFGSKLQLNEQTVAAALLARETKRPVKIILSRLENALCVGNRPSTVQNMKGGVKKDGTITALSLKSYTCGGIRRGDGTDDPFREVYKCAHCAVEEYTVYTNTGPSRPTRAPGLTQGTFGNDGFMDELANEIGMDPLEFRIKNYTVNNLGGTGIPYSSKGLDICYELGAKEIGWKRRNKIPGEGTGKIRRGIGMASQIWWGAGVPGTLADIKLHPDGSVEAICGTQDIGCGTRTYMATIPAETLGLDPEDITVKIGNTDYPWAPLSGGSLTTPSVAPAIRDASLKAAQRLRELASEKLEVDAAAVMLKNKKLFDKNDPQNSVLFSEIVRDLRRETVFHGERKGIPQGFAYNSFGAHFAEVEVDTDTGQIKVIKVVAAHEVGRIINRQTAESQVIGGVTQGISSALFEKRMVDDQTGRLVNPNLRDYKIATSMDIPDIVTIFVDIVDPRINILGTKGLGEPPRIPIAGAIGNAVYNAIGVPIREIPMTPDKVLKTLQNKEAGR